MCDNNNSPHGMFHRFSVPFSGKFSDLNFTSYVLYIYLCYVTCRVTCHTQCAWIICDLGRFSTVAQSKIRRPVKRYCNELDIKLVLTAFNFRNLFSVKDSVPRELRSRVPVYKFTCAYCNACYNNHRNAMVTLHTSTVWPNLHACAQQGTRRVAAMDSCSVLFSSHQHGKARRKGLI